MEKVASFLKAAIERKIGKRTFVGVVTLAVLALISWVFQDWVTQTLLPYLWTGLQMLMAKPVGFFGLLLVGALLVLLVGVVLAAIIDSSPRIARWLEPKPTPTVVAAPVPLSLEEREQVQHVRTLWNMYGVYATDHLVGSFTGVTHLVAKVNYLANLLRPVGARLQAARNAMSAAVADDSTMPLVEVQSRLNNVFAAYLDAYGWLVMIHDNGQVSLAKEPGFGLIADWRKSHAAFRDKLEELHERPEHRGLVRTFRDVIDEDKYFQPRKDPPSSPTARLS
jgi:hypothetical protein